MVTLKKLFIRTAIVAFWLILIGIFLYLAYLLPARSTVRSINVFAWSGMFDLKHIARFEKQTGIRVNVSFYESNEELLVKLRATKGRGYDLIFPSDYAVNILKRENLLKKLDKTKLPFVAQLNPILLGHYFDPANEYSIPYEWSIYGIGFNKESFKDKQVEPSWRLLFDSIKMPSKVVMPNDPLLAIPITAFYLYGHFNIVTKDMLPAIYAVLVRQKPFVEAYADLRASYYLQSKNVTIAVISSADGARIIPNYPFIDFLVPKEGSLVTIESFALPTSTDKDELVYEFMKFMYTPHMLVHNFKVLGFFPPTLEALSLIKAPPTIQSLLSMSRDQFARFSFLKLGSLEGDLSEQDFYDLWVAVKS